MRRAGRHVGAVSLVLVLSAVVGYGALRALASDSESIGTTIRLKMERRSMVGLPSVRVLVEDPDPSYERVGLTRDAIKARVELRLRRAGIRVLSDDEQSQSARQPRLHVTVGGGGAGGELYFSYSIMVQFMQNVQPLGTDDVVLGITWNRGSTGSVGSRVARERLLERVDNFVDEFGNCFLAANPVSK